MRTYQARNLNKSGNSATVGKTAINREFWFLVKWSKRSPNQHAPFPGHFCSNEAIKSEQKAWSSYLRILEGK